MRDLRQRQDRVLIASGVPASVSHAMDCWVIFMSGGKVTAGYPQGAAGFVSGGINCFDDLTDEAVLYAGKSVDGVVKGFSSPQKDAINVVFLGCKTNYRLMDIDGMVIDLLPIIWRGLVAKGVA